MSLSTLAAALHGTVNGGWINIRGPNHGPTDRSLGFKFIPGAPDGFIVNSLAGDEEAITRPYLKSLLNEIKTYGAVIVEINPGASPTSKNTEIARAIFEDAMPVTDTPAEMYVNTRKILAPAMKASDALRFHPACPFGPQLKVPALVCRVQNVVSGSFQAIHRIALRDDGCGKREMPHGLSAKRLLGPARNGAIILGNACEHTAIAEGPETTLSAAHLFGVPVWSMLSASGIASFPVIGGVKRLTIFADNDSPGLDAARRCANRYQLAGTLVEIKYPKKIHTDWNDYLCAQGE